MAEALGELSPEHRVVVIRGYRGQSVAQLAEELRVPPGTVLTQMFLGLRALRLALQERGLFEP